MPAKKPRLEKPDAEELKKVFDKDGVAGVNEYLGKKLDAWKEVPLYIGVTGRSGVGKSSLINALRGLSAEDDGAAEVGVTETTTEVQNYPHPSNPQLILCDLPGVGTPSFSRRTYFTDSRIGFDRFEMFLILTADRFMEDDLWLARGIKERGKGFLFVRTKIDQDVENEKKTRKAFYRSNPGAVQDVITKIRTNCEQNLQEFLSGNKDTKTVFLVDCYECDNPMYEFNGLLTHLIENFPALKRDALIMSLTALTPGLIEAKEKVLRGRIHDACILGALAGLVPIPGLNVKVNVAIVLREVKFYQQQLGLETGKLKQVAKDFKVKWGDFKRKAKLKSTEIQMSEDGILKFCSRVEMSAIGMLGLAIPILGSIVGARSAYKVIENALNEILDMMVSDAKRLNEFIKTSSISSTML